MLRAYEKLAAAAAGGGPWDRDGFRGFDRGFFLNEVPASPKANIGAGAEAATVRFGIPKTLEFFGEPEAEKAWLRALDLLETKLQWKKVVLEDFDKTFVPVAEGLYAGPWVGERWAALEPVIYIGALAAKSNTHLS